MFEQKYFEDMIDLLMVVAKNDPDMKYLFELIHDESERVGVSFYAMAYKKLGQDPYIRNCWEILLGKGCTNLYPEINDDLK